MEKLALLEDQGTYGSPRGGPLSLPHERKLRGIVDRLSLSAPLRLCANHPNAFDKARNRK